MDELGDRMKFYEAIEVKRVLMPTLPICCRLDGKCFSKFTKDLARPYDEKFSKIMIDITRYLVEETNACIGYTQSDEISLILYSEDIKSQTFFNGRIQKLNSVLASMATAKLMYLLFTNFPKKIKELPSFDCRIWNVPSKIEAVNNLIWRQMDCSKNSISMAASSYTIAARKPHPEGRA